MLPRRVKIQVPGLVDPNELVGDRQFAMNLARGLEVLRAFSVDASALSNKELCDITGLPKATVARLTYTLVLLGFLTQNPLDQRYSLGSSVLSLAHPLLATMNVRGIARPFMQELAVQTGCSVNLGVRDRDLVIYVEVARADKKNPLLPDIGTTRPLLATSIGRVLILANAPNETQQIINRLKTYNGESYQRHAAALQADMLLYKNEKYCHARNDWHPDLHGIGVAVTDAKSRTVYGLSCALKMNGRPDEHLRLEVLPKLRAICEQIEAALSNEQRQTDRPAAIRAGRNGRA